MADTIRAYRSLVGAQVRSQAQYRLSFALDVLVTSFVSGIEVVAILLLFRVTPTLGGFSVRDVLVMTTMCEVGFQLADFLVGNVEAVARYVRTGLMDTVLIRPRSALGQLLAVDFPVRKFGRLLQALTMYVAVLAWADLDWTLPRALLAVGAPVAGAALYSAIFVAGATVAFWWIDSGEFANAFTYGGRQFGSYPINVYAPWLRVVFAYGLGMAFTGYQPALALLGRPDPLGAPDWLAWCTPVVGAVAWAGALLLWNTGIRHYRSTGS
ncbi:ABC transporter permease [Yinghuangia seranimata]|uniref:ABC transporter permease n=1 Tax=Yinghuangia seranimata TaxID=408067 RepID=UPI00248AAD15|nr:ABC-2 family transporter protein [Yinghuangia seranimata]MDI2132135.1 ABC-2 family transporter protein [Yinghuangia seranimata]